MLAPVRYFRSQIRQDQEIFPWFISLKSHYLHHHGSGMVLLFHSVLYLSSNNRARLTRPAIEARILTINSFQGVEAMSAPLRRGAT